MFTEITFQTSHIIYILNIDILGQGFMPSFQPPDTEYLTISPSNIRKLLKHVRSTTYVWCLSLNIIVEVLGGRWRRRIKQNWNSSQESKLEVTNKTVPPEMPKSSLWDEIYSSQRTTLILIYHTFFLTINETLKEKKNNHNKTPNPKPVKKKSKCHSIYKTQTILLKLFLCTLCILSFQHTTFYFYQMLHLDTLQCSYTKSIISLNFIMLIILIHHSLKSWFFHWNCEISKSSLKAKTDYISQCFV